MSSSFFALVSVRQDAPFKLSNVTIRQFSFFTFVRVVQVLKKGAHMPKIGQNSKTKNNFWNSTAKGMQWQMVELFISFISMICKNKHHPTMWAIVGYWAPSLTDQLAKLGLKRLAARRERLCARFAAATATKSCHKEIFEVAQINHPRPRKRSRVKSPDCSLQDVCRPLLD